MRTFNVTLGGRPVTVFAPEVGDPGVAMIRNYLPGGRLYGLDMESTGFELLDVPVLRDAVSTRSGPGPYHPNWRMRLIQFGTPDYAWVLNVEDPLQRAAAIELLSDTTVHFVSHTKIDPVAAALALGVDIIDRTLDTYPLSVMASPDHREGGNELKPHATRLGMVELAEYDKKLNQIHCDIWNRDHVAYNKDGSVSKANQVKVSHVTGKAPEKAISYGFTHVDIDNPTYLIYAGLDAIAVLRVAEALRRETRAPASLIKAERWLSQQATRISHTGHRLDMDRTHDMYVAAVEAMKEPGEKVKELSGFIARSPKLKEYFYALGLGLEDPDSDYPRSNKGRSKDMSLSKEHLPLLLSYDLPDEAREVVDALVTYKSHMNRATVTQQLLDRAVGGRIHPTLKTVGTVTGRMSASDPNMQNFSKKDPELRMLFIPDTDEHVFMSCDFAQIELRVLAALAQEPEMIATILEGGDLHSLTGRLLGISRDAAKTVNFLIVYGGGGKKLATQLGVPEGKSLREFVDECYEVIRNYWRQYRSIDDYKRWVERLDEVVLISGRRVPTDPNRRYANLNYGIQGNARELLAGAWLRYGVQYGRAETMKMPIHDEKWLQVLRVHADAVAKEVADCMSFNFEGVPIVAEPDILLDKFGDSRWMPGDHARKINPRCEQVYLGDGAARKCGRLKDHPGDHGAYATLGELDAATRERKVAA